MRPPKSLKRVLESRNAEMTENANDDTNFKASEPTSTKDKRWKKDVFKLVLPPDLVKDLENSSDEVLTRSTKSNSVKNSTRQPTIEILSSSDEEDLADNYHPLPGRSSVENNVKSLPEENSSLANKRMSPVLNSSTPKRHKSNLLYPMKQKSIQSLKKRVELDSEDSVNDPFGFEAAEKRVRKRNIQRQFSSDNPGKFEVTTIDRDNQYNDNVQSEITKRISLNKETNKNDTNGSSAFSEIDKQDRKQENKEPNTLNENEKDGDNYQIDSSKSQSTHDESHLSTENTENDKGSAESSGLPPIKTPKDRNKKVEKKNTTPSKVKKALLKTSDLIPLLPLRRRQERASKKNADKYNDFLFDDDEVFLDEKKGESDYEEKTLPKKRKVRKMQSEKSEKKHRKIILSSDSEDEQTKQERAERIRHAEEIDNFELAEEVID